MWIKWITRQSNVWFVQVVHLKGEKRQEERKIDRSEGEAGGRSQGDVEEEKIELSKNCQNGFRKNSRDAAQMDDAAARRCSREFYRELRRQR